MNNPANANDNSIELTTHNQLNHESPTQTDPKAPRIYSICKNNTTGNSPMSPSPFYRKDLSDKPSGLDGLKG
jgi:hypothetical protein